MKSPHWKTLWIVIPIILVYYFICWALAGFGFSCEMNWLDYLLTVIGVGIFDIISGDEYGEEAAKKGIIYNQKHKHNV